MDFLEIILDLTETFYLMINNLISWFSTPIIIGGLDIFGIVSWEAFSFTPIEIIFNWTTLGIILGAILFKKLVPFGG